MRLMRVSSLRFVAALVLMSAVSSSQVPAQSRDDPELLYDGKHRINAHGNEFNGLAKSSDGNDCLLPAKKERSQVGDHSRKPR